jgi:hypothetical protein
MFKKVVHLKSSEKFIAKIYVISRLYAEKFVYKESKE